MNRSQCHTEAGRLAKAYRASMAVCQLPGGFDVIDAESLTADGLAAASGSLVAVYGADGKPLALPDLGTPTPTVSATLARLDRMVYGECIGFDTASGGWLTVYRSVSGYGIDRWAEPNGYSLTVEQVEEVIDNS